MAQTNTLCSVHPMCLGLPALALAVYDPFDACTMDTKLYPFLIVTGLLMLVRPRQVIVQLIYHSKLIADDVSVLFPLSSHQLQINQFLFIFL